MLPPQGSKKKKKEMGCQIRFRWSDLIYWFGANGGISIVGTRTTLMSISNGKALMQHGRIGGGLFSVPALLKSVLLAILLCTEATLYWNVHIRTTCDFRNLLFRNFLWRYFHWWCTFFEVWFGWRLQYQTKTYTLN